jgi:hypothetical protein
MASDVGRLGFRIEEVKLTAPSLPAGGPPLRLAHLADLHMRGWSKRHERLLEVVTGRRPDFVFLTGDLVAFSSSTWETLERLVRGLRGTYGTFACRGNWELKMGLRAAELREMLAGWGAELLVNESRTVQTPSGRICVSGLDDLGKGWPDFGSVGDGGDGAGYGILLCHEPLAARFVTEAMKVHLLLTGHTHGGQIRIPLLWRLALPECHGGYPEGLYKQPWGHLYVNRGYGGGGIVAVRFRCPAEVAFFEIVPGRAMHR